MTGFGAGNASGGHEDLGAYLLGGLWDDERKAFDGHVSHCPQCRRELALLSGLPARLDALSEGEANRLLAEAPDPTPDGDGLLGRLRVRRRAVRRRMVALAATVALLGAAAGAAVGYVAAERPGPAHPAPDASYAMVSERGVRAHVDLGRKAWGTEVSLQASHLPTSGLLELWVVDSEGKADRAGSWSATDTGNSAITGAVPVQLPAIEWVQVRSGSRLVLAEVRLPDAEAGDDGAARSSGG